MNPNATINPVPHHGSHSHFYNWIEFGDHLPLGDSLDDQHRKTQKKLRNQYLHDNNFENKLCFRNCFKLSDKRYVEFCLDKRCHGAGFLDAARQLGYVKE